MIWNNDFERIACKVITSFGYYPPEDHLGLAYICFCEDMEGFDPMKASESTYYSYRLRERLQREKRYGGLVHVPVLKKGESYTSVVGIDAPIGSQDELTYADILSNPQEGTEEALEAFLIDECSKIYPQATKGIQKAIEAFVADLKQGIKPPRKLRQEMTNLRKILFDRYTKKYLSNGT